jgi:hypothetical protein
MYNHVFLRWSRTSEEPVLGMEQSLSDAGLLDMLTFVIQYQIHERQRANADDEFENRRDILRSLYLQKDPLIDWQLDNAFAFAERLLHVRYSNLNS